jgi:hypothetical protein
MSVRVRKLCSAGLVSLCAVAGTLSFASAPASGAYTHPFVTSFGSFTTVGGVAVDQSSGDVYVLDVGAEGGSLLKFDATGKPLKFTGLSGEPTAITGLGGGGEGENEIAVDNSAGPTKGDVYVAVSYTNSYKIDVIAPDGKSLGQLTEASGAPWGETCGVAVDPSGEVYVGVFGKIDKFVPKANPVTDSDYVSSIGGANEACNLAADSAGNVFGVQWAVGPVWRYEPSQFGSLNASGSIVDVSGTTLTVDPSNDHVYVDEHTRVSEFGSHGEPFEEPLSRFGETGEGAIIASEGIAVNAVSEDIYVSDGKGKLSVFGPGIVTPTVVTGQASGLTGHSATVGGTVNPEGGAITECRFEYGTSETYGHSVPCASDPGSGTSPVAVSAEVPGLNSGAIYHFRLVASNAAGEGDGLDETFTTAQALITGEALDVTLEGATLGGSVNPEGIVVTSCKFQYGLTTSYGQSAPCVALPGSGNEPVDVTGALSGLRPNGRYHYRLVIANENGESFGADRMLTTEGPFDKGIPGLPDGRVYEMVTNPDNGNAEVYEPKAGGPFSNIETQLPFQAAVDGDAMAYVGSPSVGGNENAYYNSGNDYVARRSKDGAWTQTNISPVGFPSAVVQGFANDLSAAFLDSEEGMTPGAPGFGEEVLNGGNYDIPYTASTDGRADYVPLVATTPPYRSKFEFETYAIYHAALGVPIRKVDERSLAYAGASSDFSHVLFEANDALTPSAEGGTAKHFSEENNLYESVHGALRLVNVLPDGSTEANATFGGPILKVNGAADSNFSPAFSHAISNDGSRIFWTDLNTGHIYMRENGTSTVEISSAGRYWTSTPDGSKVFYTNGDLYMYDVGTAQTTDLTPGVAVQGVIGTSESGDYVYYVTADFDLDVWHDGITSTIKTLAATDNENLLPFNFNVGGDWMPGFSNRMAEVSPDGHGLVFMYTGGDKNNVGSVEVYDADSGRVYCASCGWGGAGGFVPLTFSNTYLKRWISEDGSRVFFDSSEALVPQDTNGRLDAYEWERPGSGSCKSSTGCIYLLSGGTSNAESYFADASANGDDVFIVTRAKLLSKDDNEFYDLYDVRVDGFEPVTVPQCTGTGCQGVPGGSPIFATPSSMTFEGLGNFAAPTSILKAKPKTKPKKKPKPRRTKRHTKAKKGSKASRRAGNGRKHTLPSGKGGRSS